MLNMIERIGVAHNHLLQMSSEYVAEGSAFESTTLSRRERQAGSGQNTLSWGLRFETKFGQDVQNIGRITWRCGEGA